MTALASSKLYILTGDSTSTQVSGKTPGWSTWVGPSSSANYQGLYEVTMWEDGDSPCKIRVKSRHLNNYTGQTDSWSDGQCSPSSSSAKTVGFPNSDTYIRGVNVCLNKKGTRIKGLRLYGTKLNRATGQLEHLSGYKEWKRPNCNNWRTIRYCPAGQIARSIGVQYQAQMFIGDEIAGLKLSCRKVSEK